MNPKQIAIILHQIHLEKLNDIEMSLNKKLSFFKLDNKLVKLEEIKELFENGIKHLNQVQLANIINGINSKGLNENEIEKKLKFYEIDNDYFQNILDFLKGYALSMEEVDVSEIDQNFRGIQVASRDDFNVLINQGYTGDWVLNPNSIVNNLVQVASMNENGNFPRGNYLKAEIVEVREVNIEGQIRFRIFFRDPVIVDSGNRNIKFNTNPVKYIN